jgi:hypothetical protein
MPQAVSRPSAVPTLNEVIPPVGPMGTTGTRLFRRDLVRVSSCCCEGWRYAPAGLGGVALNAMQDDGQLARYGDMALAMPRR